MATSGKSAAVSHVGKVRANNQDSGYAGKYLFVVADGMGGHAGGDVASAIALKRVMEADRPYASARDAEFALQSSLIAANSLLAETVFEHPELMGMGTTVSAILRSGKHYKELSEGYRKTTNNRMELMAVIKGLEALKTLNQEVMIFSDSKYVIDSIEKKWVYGWLSKGFKDKKNKDLWLRFSELAENQHIKFIWVKGHANNPYNNRCDRLATTAADEKNLDKDNGYESGC